jgi:iron uptake system EfeUOB component EfeO/EfeM
MKIIITRNTKEAGVIDFDEVLQLKLITSENKKCAIWINYKTNNNLYIFDQLTEADIENIRTQIRELIIEPSKKRKVTI